MVGRYDGSKDEWWLLMLQVVEENDYEGRIVHYGLLFDVGTI